MKKLILLALLFVGCVFGDTITYNQGNNKRIIENVKFTRAGNGKVYFTIYGKESSRNCNQIIEFTDDDGNPIDYDCSVLLIEPMKTNDNDSLLNNNSKENAVIDSLIRLIDTKLTNSTDELAKLIDENTKKILNEVLWVDPLKDKKFGIEINPFYLIAGSLLGERGVLLSGSYSRFDINETAEIDECGVCDGDNSTCSDCAGVPNGDALEDNCGTCDADSSNDCVQDCSGTWGGSVDEDECGICGGDNSSCADCAGVPNGSAYEDECGTCDDNSSNDCVQDCSGEWGGTSVDDDCGVCGGDNSSCSDECGVPYGDNSSCADECGAPNGDNSTCLDCAGTPNGSAYEDECWTCDDDSSNDCVQDCMGEWGGSLENDECGICGGDNSICSDCAGVPNGSAYEDACGTCDDDSSNDCVQDCSGTWGGSTVDDECGVCGGDNSSCSDECGVPYGDNSSCSDECGVPNGDNSSCSDCAGTPNGSAYVDECGTCDDDSSNDCVQDCAGTWGGTSVADECGVCEGDGSSCNQPTASNSAISLEEDDSVNFDLVAEDPNGDALEVTVISGPSNGSLEISGLNVTYTPDDNYFGSDQFIFTVSDGQWTSGSATVSIDVLGVNDVPTAEAFTLEVESAEPTAVDFDDFVSDADGDELSILTMPPSSGETLNTMFGGTLEPTGGLQYEYTPPAGDYPSDFILFKADDGQAQSNLAFGTFNLNGGRWSRVIPPTAFDDNVAIPEDNMYYVNFVGFDVFYPFTGGETVTITRYPENGTLSSPTQLETGTQQLAQWIASYTPDEDFSGSDFIKYIVSNPDNPNGPSDEATIYITITPVNDLPELDNISNVSMAEDSEYSFTVSYSDVD